MGCCGSQNADHPRGNDDEDLIAFDYCPRTGAIIPVRRQLTVPGEKQLSRGESLDHIDSRFVHQSGDSRETSMEVMYSPNDRFSPQNMSMTGTINHPDSFADSILSPQVRTTTQFLSTTQEKFVMEGDSVDARISRLEELEQLIRSEIFGAFLVTSKMLELARKKVRPLYRHRRGVRHIDPLASAPTLVIQHDSVDHGAGRNDDVLVPSCSPAKSALPPTIHEAPAQADENAERLQVLDISGNMIQKGMKSKCRAMGNEWDFLSLPDAGDHLTQGNSYFGFLCKPASKLNEHDTVQLETIVNLTGFEDELRDNGAPRLHVRDAQEMSKYTIIMVKAMYVLPGFELTNMTRPIMASLDYQRNCQPGNPKFWDDCDEPWTFRETKPLIRFVYSMVIQLRVYEITDPEVLRSFRVLDGLLPEKVMLLERTKRDKNKADSTLKCKSLLLYYRITGGTLVTNITTVVNTSIPNVVAALVNNFGSSGAKEVGDTAVMTREYLLQKFGDCRDA
jgi:hypothetical protein